jgi:3-isopropylmalate/(R)-2-methylmalate dehydratase small subunit
MFHGKAHKVGAHIDTDAIIPARFLVTTDPVELGANCMSGLEPGRVKRVGRGDILVAGENFGCGSSREHAPVAILGAGIPVVAAHSFARIFYRNGFNMGLTLLEIGDGVRRSKTATSCVWTRMPGVIENVTTGKGFRARVRSRRSCARFWTRAVWPGYVKDQLQSGLGRAEEIFHEIRYVRVAGRRHRPGDRGARHRGCFGRWGGVRA